MLKPLLNVALVAMIASTLSCAGGDSSNTKVPDGGSTTHGDTNARTNNDAPTCGNGVLDTAEACDPVIAEGEPGACPTSCAPIACSSAELVGAAEECTARCEETTIVDCADGDGCCPSDCTSADDDDCEAICGNGIVEGDETCDGDCPTTCDDGDLCTVGTMAGSSDSCDAECTYEPISTCMDGDDCCPEGCTSNDDSECASICGNDITEGGETCDGDCPASCGDGVACTSDTMVGDADSCDVACLNDPITACTSNDGCCPAGCNANDDDDCSPVCGNDVIENGEACDGDCPSTCDDGVACTADAMTGDATTCDVACQNMPITTCTDGDGCCAMGCTSANDTDCAPVCGNDVVESGEVCDGDCPFSCDDGDVCTNDIQTGSAATCDLTCSNAEITACVDGDGCCASGCGPTDDDDCSQDQPIGGAANSWGDCQSGVYYPKPVTGGYCTDYCDVDADCPADSDCSSAGTCLQDCFADSDCRAGGDYACFDADYDGDLECWAIGSGTEIVGAPCNEYADCTGGAGGRCLAPNQGFQDGYCTQTCTAASGCPTGSHCGWFDTDTGRGACLANCISNSDCRSNGYLCFDWDGDATTECAPAATGSGEVGDVCEETYDCSGGADGHCIEEGRYWKDGYCSAECSTSRPCPSGSHCYDPDGDGEGACLADCAGSGECRLDGYLCLDPDNDNVGECWTAATGTEPVGSACAGNWECVGGEWGFCIGHSDWPDGYCTIECEAGEGTCPSGSVCDGNVCLAACAGDGDCRTGYVCQAGSGVCAPP